MQGVLNSRPIYILYAPEARRFMQDYLQAIGMGRKMKPYVCGSAINRAPTNVLSIYGVGEAVGVPVPVGLVVGVVAVRPDCIGTSLLSIQVR